MFVLLGAYPENDEIEYVKTYGPYDTRAAAEAAIPNLPNSDMEWRVKELGDIADFIKEYHDQVEEDTYNALIIQHRGVENVPAPNATVRNWALATMVYYRDEALPAAEASNDKHTAALAKKKMLFWDKIAQKHRPAA
jgi:hypothetical protein